MPKKNSATAFLAAYKQLNSEQKKAVDAIEGPVMVIAGPGTGKTQVLTVRIANILHSTDTAPESVLAITFTEAGVIAMRKRLASLIGSQAYQVAITTFHSFANRIIQNYPEEFPRIIGSKPMTDVDQIRIVESVIDTAKNIKILRPFGDRFHYIRDVVNGIKELKREGITPEDFAQLAIQEKKSFTARDDLHHEKGRFKGKMKGEHEKYLKQIEKNAELSLLYSAYQEALTKQKLYDYDDMIVEALLAMKNNETLLRSLQEQYQYVLVDEHQDTNNAQNKILEVLMSYHDNPNLFIVGDEKQAIFRFQGASLENFHYFKDKFSDAKLIALTNNYRSTQTILDAAVSLVVQSDPVSLKARAGHPEKNISVHELNTADSELYFVAQHIKQRLASGATPEEIAVLYRINRDATPLTRILQKVGVPFHIESDLDILADPDIRRVVHILEAVQNFGSQAVLFPVLYLDTLHIDPVDVHTIAIASSKGDVDPYALISSIPLMKKNGIRSPEELKKVYDKLVSWKSCASNRGLLELFDAIVNESGLLQAIVARPDAVDALDKLGVFLDQARKLLESNPDASLGDFMDHLSRMREHRIFIRGTLSGRQPGKIRLMTAHRSKGLEFEHVYIINCHDTNWGNRYDVQKLPLIDRVYSLSGTVPSRTGDADERNLFYVSLTRAKREVVISYAKHSLEQREQLPSKFITELKPELVTFQDSTPHEEQFQTHRDVLFAQAVQQPSMYTKEFVKDLFTKRGFAVTHLNNYLRCPWEYFFVNLLRIPQGQDKSLLYGDAIHATLQDFFNKRQTDPATDEKYLVDRFQYHAQRRPFVPSDREEAIERGTATLTGYYAKYAPQWSGKVLSEFKIQGVELAPGIVLTGNIDRLEFSSNDTVTVTDYKTGRPKSRNEIEGKTRAADGSYKRQLIFYNLLLNRHNKGKYRMENGVIDFIEPDSYGKYHREAFVIQPTEIQELEDLIKKTATEIVNLEFWNRTCGRDDCRYCAMRSLMPST